MLGTLQAPSQPWTQWLRSTVRPPFSFLVKHRYAKVADFHTEVLDQDVENYQRIKTKLGGHDDMVLKFLEARKAFSQARSEALVAAAAKSVAAKAAAEAPKKEGDATTGGAGASGAAKKDVPLISPEHKAARDMMDKLTLDLGLTVRLFLLLLSP